MMNKNSPSPDNKRNFEDNLSEWIFDDSLEEKRLAPLKGVVKQDPDLQELKLEYEQLRDFLKEEPVTPAPAELKLNVMNRVEGRTVKKHERRAPSGNPARWATAASLLAVAVLAGRELYQQADQLEHQPNAAFSVDDSKADAPAMDPVGNASQSIYSQNLRAPINGLAETENDMKSSANREELNGDDTAIKGAVINGFAELAEKSRQMTESNERKATRNALLDELEGKDLDRELGRYLTELDGAQLKKLNEANAKLLGKEVSKRRQSEREAEVMTLLTDNLKAEKKLTARRIRVAPENREVFLRWCMTNSIKPREVPEEPSLGYTASGEPNQKAPATPPKPVSPSEQNTTLKRADADLEFRSGRVAPVNKSQSNSVAPEIEEEAQEALGDESKKSAEEDRRAKNKDSKIDISDKNVDDEEWLYFEILPLNPEALKQLEKEIAAAEAERKRKSDESKTNTTGR